MGAEEANVALESQDARGREQEIRQWRKNLWRAYVDVLDQYIRSSDDRLNVWRASLQAFRQGDGDAGLLEKAVRNLALWWGAVEKREGVDSKARDIIVNQLRAANRMIGEERAKDHESETVILIDTQNIVTELQGRVNLYGHGSKK
jgi:hypothetical protein